MADNVTTQSATPATLPASTVISTEEVTNLNGSAVTAQHVQRLLPTVRTADGTAQDVDSSHPLPVTMSTPSGAATAANQASEISTLADILAALPVDPATQTTLAAVLAKLSADPATQTTLAAILAKLNASLAVTGTFYQATQPVSGTVTANAGTNLNTSALALESGGTLDDILTAILAVGTAVAAQADQTEAQPVSDNGGSLTVDGTFWQATQPVSLASVPSHPVTNAGTFATQAEQLGTWTVGLTKAATPTQTSVPNATSSTSLLASNTSRLGATIFNDDTASTGATLKVKLGATASSTSYTVAIAPQGYYEVPYGYTGAIDGIASAATGNARITELT